jgi:endonuclease YncB( thermonuclease family)
MKFYLCFISLLANFAFFDASANTILEGKVVSVADGDTLTVLDNRQTPYKVRLLGIDAPEKKQAFGEKSKQSLVELAHGKNVRIVFNKKDKYGRIVGQVFVGALDICHQQIKSGLAWHYKKYQNEQSIRDRDAYSASEISAQSQQLGLWSDPRPVAPWDYRNR